MAKKLEKKTEELTPEDATKVEETVVETPVEGETQEVQEEVTPKQEEPVVEEQKAEEVKEESASEPAIEEEPKEEEKPAEEPKVESTEQPSEPQEEAPQEEPKEEPKVEESAPVSENEEEPKAEVEEPASEPIEEKQAEDSKPEKKKKEPKPEKTKVKEPKSKKNEEEVPENKNKKHRLSRTARKRRLIILITTLYLDAVIILLCYKYVGFFLNGFFKLIGGDLNGSIGNRDFATSLLLLVVLIIINIISLSFYHDARKIKDKAPDDLLAMLGDTDSVDGHRIVESEYNVEEDTKQVVYRNAKTIESINISEVQENFIKTCQENGIEMDKSKARLVLASVFASRLLIIKEDNTELKQKFMRVLAGFFGNDDFLTELGENVVRFDDVVWRLTSEGNVPTAFSRGLSASRQFPDKVNMVMLDGVKADSMERVYKEILGYIKNPNITCSLRIGNRNVDNGFRQLPKNVWFMFGMKKEDLIPSEVAKYAISLELELKATEPSAEKTKFKPVDYPQLLDCLNESYENHFIEEDNWKKLDTFNEYLNDRGDFFIDNRIVREMERFAAIYLALDGDQADLIDTLLTVKLLLIALPNEYKKRVNDDEGLVAKTESILGGDFITKSAQLLKKIKFD